ncbi:hypothetical protein PV08_02563 [Exophiala spinifera]|uniref:Cytochrome P450 n=1 Tax=Exophiala spinifera TaxID=91928 RepID=A0A0D2BI17_9EURO|nr:uncharacterized protein PV08_02563 [Exophiala spinifera]KIW18275.1 hypothetical protein PV08_02563 [Exophiala spinifera]
MSFSQESYVTILRRTITSFLTTHPFLAALTALVALCIITRIFSGLELKASTKQRQSRNSPTATPPPLLPYWIPWLGHGLNFALGGNDFLTQASKSLGAHGSIFTLWMANSKHHVVTVPGIEKQLISREAPLTSEPFIYRIMEKFWGDGGSVRATDPAAVWGPIHGALNALMREDFVASALSDTVKALETGTWNLISGLDSPVDQTIWEREADVQIVSRGSRSDNDDSLFVAEAELWQLMRYFVGEIATTVLMGRDFLQNHPAFMHDLWELDEKFNLFVAGVPGWFPSMAAAAGARERVLAAIADHHDAMFKFLDGGDQDPGSRWADMSDVSPVIVKRAVEFRKAGGSRRAWTTGNAAIVWVMNINSNAVIFWMIWYIFSDASLVDELRRELAPYVRFVPPPTPRDTGLPIREAPRLKIELGALWTKCPLLKGAFFETMRLEAASMSYKKIVEDFVVSESEDDARMLGKSEPERFLLRKGEFVCIPHGVHQTDEKYFRDPTRFDPRRFWAKEDDGVDVDVVTSNDDDGEEEEEEEEEGGGGGGENKSSTATTATSRPTNPEAQTGTGMGNYGASPRQVDYGTMRVWGGGKHMCKGKTFAEREVLLFVAAVVMQWDMAPVGNGGRWVHPGRKPGGGAVNPVEPVRVRMRRREGW